MDRNVCRLCGEYNAQNERIYDKNSCELLHKIQTSMPIIIHQNDPLPNKICLKCKDFVEVSFDRIQKMKNVQNNLIYELEKQDVFHKYLQIIREIKDHNYNALKAISNIADKLDAQDNLIVVRPFQLTDLPDLIEPLQIDIKQETVSEYGDNNIMVSPILPEHSKTQHSPTDFNSEEIQKDVTKKRLIGVWPNHEIDSAKEEENYQEQLSNRITGQNAANKERISGRTRGARVNYSEALVDQALVYEMMVAEKVERAMSDQRQLIKRTRMEQRKEQANNFDLLAHRKSPKLMENINNKTISSEIDPQNEENVFGISINEISETFKSDPGSIVHINQSVSIQLKNGTNTSGSKVTARKRTAAVRNRYPCNYCKLIFLNFNALARHQVSHMKISLLRLDEPLVLNKDQRSSNSYTLGEIDWYRCLNCNRVFLKQVDLVSHWNSAKCRYHCIICKASFHDDPNQLKPHLLNDHKVQFELGHDQVDFDDTSYETALQSLIDFIKKRSKPVRQTTKMDVPTIPRHSRKASKIPLNKIFSNKLIKFNAQNEKRKNKNDKGKFRKPQIMKQRFKCDYCCSVFPSHQSRNAHVRIHKEDWNENRDARRLAMQQAAANKRRLKQQVPIVIKQEPADSFSLPNPPDWLVQNFNSPKNSSAMVHMQVAQSNSLSVSSNKAEVYQMAHKKNPKMHYTQPSKWKSWYQEKNFKTLPIPTIIKSISCVPCGSRFLDRRQLHLHKKVCTEATGGPCSICFQYFPTIMELRVHINKVHNSNNLNVEIPLTEAYQ